VSQLRDHDDVVTNPTAESRFDRASIVLIAILLLATVLRSVHLGRNSFWYDEVITMRLAEAKGPGALLQLLKQIDATRAPLHPLLLQGWITLFGPSEQSSRALSVICGVMVTGVVYWIGVRVYEPRTALWAAWLCTLSPLLVYYSREVRMYMWLVLLTCLAWGSLFAHARDARRRWLGLYGLSLVGLAYSHPLGLVMVGTLGSTSLLYFRAFRLSPGGWLCVHLAVMLTVMPWVTQYTNHPPESMSGLLPLRYLLGMPIGFVGGNFIVLLVCAMLIVYGILNINIYNVSRIEIGLEPVVLTNSLLLWLLIPPVFLYVYSRVAYPIFGPARYTLFVGPPYLLLLAHGVRKLPVLPRLAVAATGAILAGTTLAHDVYRSDLKADWKAAAAYLDEHDRDSSVSVISATPSSVAVLETARYYFGPRRIVQPWSSTLNPWLRNSTFTWVAVGLQDGRVEGSLLAELAGGGSVGEVVDFPGLRLFKVKVG
jgi:4-amino-4-deoxy-L-arabinose transferase-like glycosyltransferase